MKRNAVFDITQTFAREGNVLENQAIRLIFEKEMNCPVELRIIRFICAEDKSKLYYLQ